MKKLLMAAMAALTLIAVPAQAQQFEVRIGTEQTHRNYRYDNYDYGRSGYYNHFRNFDRAYFRNLPNAQRQRCNYSEVIVRNPYNTNKLVCMPREDYRRYYSR